MVDIPYTVFETVEEVREVAGEERFSKLLNEALPKQKTDSEILREVAAWYDNPSEIKDDLGMGYGRQSSLYTYICLNIQVCSPTRKQAADLQDYVLKYVYDKEDGSTAYDVYTGEEADFQTNEESYPARALACLWMALELEEENENNPTA